MVKVGGSATCGITFASAGSAVRDVPRCRRFVRKLPMVEVAHYGAID